MNATASPKNAPLTVAQRTNLDGFPKAAELIEMRGAEQLTAMDRALLNLLYQHAHDSGRLVEQKAEFEIPLHSLRRALSEHKGNGRLKESLWALTRVSVQVTYMAHANGGTPPEKRAQFTGLFEFLDVSDDEDLAKRPTLKFALHPRLRDVLSKSGRWGRIKAEIVCTMRSKYAIALYEIIQLRANLDTCVQEMSIERFRELMGVPEGSYEDGVNFKKRVIDPALFEVNGLSDMTVFVELRRKHLRAPIDRVAISWSRKEGQAFRDAVRERERPKVGRRARLRGTVEPVVATFTDKQLKERAEKSN